MKRWIPRKGQVFESREALEARLLEAGWDFEGQGTAFDNSKIISHDIGVTDEKNDIWIMVDMKPLGVKVTKVKKLKLSDYGGK